MESNKNQERTLAYNLATPLDKESLKNITGGNGQEQIANKSERTFRMTGAMSADIELDW